MAKTRSRSRSSRSGGRRTYAARPWLAELLGRPEESLTHQIIGWVIRARAELTVLFLLGTGQVMLMRQFELTYDQAVITEVVVIGVALAIPGTRRTLLSRTWAVLDRHRMRACFIQTRTMTPAGSLPLLLWSSPTPVGERVRVWLRAGLSVNDIAQITDELAAACYAAHTRVTVSPRMATYVVVDVIRRDPLTGKRLIRGAVTQGLPGPDPKDPYAFPGKVTPAELDAHPEYFPTGNTSDQASNVRPLPDRTTLPTKANANTNGTAARKDTTKKPAHRETKTESANPPTVLGVDGTDVSDYV